MSLFVCCFSVCQSVAITKEALASFELRCLLAAEARVACDALQCTQQILTQLVALACKERRLSELLPVLQGIPVPEKTLATVLTDCSKQAGATLSMEVIQFARSCNIAFSESMYALLIMCCTKNKESGESVIEESMASNTECCLESMLVVITFCGQFVEHWSGR